MVKYYNVNGEQVLREHAVIGIEDIGLLRGFGIFDFFRFKGGCLIFGPDYLNRFTRSAQKIGLPLPVSISELTQWVHNLIEANGQPEGAIQFVLTGGYSLNNYEPASPNLLILQRELPIINPDYYANGVKLLLVDYQREMPEIKTTNYLKGIHLLPTLREAGALEPLYHTGDFLRESVRSNIFVVNAEGVICTPDKEVLPGITRKQVLEIAGRKFRAEEREVSLSELFSAREVFMTSTIKRLMPVVQIGDQTIGNGKPGPVFKELTDDFNHFEKEFLATNKL